MECVAGKVDALWVASLGALGGGSGRYGVQGLGFAYYTVVYLKHLIGYHQLVNFPVSIA